MKEKIKQFMNTKQFHICVIICIIFIILFVVSVISIKYSVEGEANPPFFIKKISIISCVEGTNNDDNENRWNITVNQNNDIYLYIAKNESYSQTEIIQSVVIENFQVLKEPEIGIKKIYKPDSSIDTTLFKNSDENISEKIEYKGSLETNIKNLEISNQGDKVIFRYAITNVGQYISNEDEEINHSQLLKKLNLNNDNIKTKISFDVNIKLESEKIYKAKVQLELPINDIVDGGIQSIDITDLDNIIFKR